MQETCTKLILIVKNYSGWLGAKPLCVLRWLLVRSNILGASFVIIFSPILFFIFIFFSLQRLLFYRKHFENLNIWFFWGVFSQSKIYLIYKFKIKIWKVGIYVDFFGVCIFYISHFKLKNKKYELPLSICLCVGLEIYL